MAARRKLIDQFIWLDRVQWLWRESAAAGNLPLDGDSHPLREFDLVTRLSAWSDPNKVN